MKIFTSYFYMIRFFKPWQVPVSTALYDPKWFHAFKGQDFKFLDKRNVINGLRAELLHPGKSCEGLCHGKVGCAYTPESCQFMKNYKQQILMLDKTKILDKFQALANKIQTKVHHAVDIVLIVHEAPTNPCSERSVLQEAFNCKELEIVD